MNGMTMTPYETIARENMARVLMNGGLAPEVDDAAVQRLDAPMLEDPIAGIRFFSVAEMRTAPPPVWLVSGVIPQNKLMLVYGASGSGKTFLMLDLAMSIARGSRWFGRRVQQGGVIYVAGEGNLKPRVDAYMTHWKLTDDDVKGFRGRSTALNLRTPDGDDRQLLIGLENTAAEMGRVDLVVLDTLNALMAGGDENSSHDMGRMIAVARQIMTRLNCSVAYVHHPGKAEDRGARGHSSLKAAVDTEIYVEGGDPRVASITKQRDGETGIQFAYKLVTVDLGPSPDPEADTDDRYTSCAVEPAELPAGKTGLGAALSPAQQTVLRVLNELCAQNPAVMSDADRDAAGIGAEQAVTTVAAWREAAYQAEIADGGKDAKRKAFERALEVLVEKGCVKKLGDFAWTDSW
jgi:hypothetical protein